MSDSESQPDIGDEQLPEDLRPDEDNPLAGGLEDGERVDDLLEEGKGAEQDEEKAEDEEEEEEGA
jgi:hypothetical protein